MKQRIPVLIILNLEAKGGRIPESVISMKNSCTETFEYVQCRDFRHTVLALSDDDLAVNSPVVVQSDIIVMVN